MHYYWYRSFVFMRIYYGLTRPETPGRIPPTPRPRVSGTPIQPGRARFFAISSDGA